MPSHSGQRAASESRAPTLYPTSICPGSEAARPLSWNLHQISSYRSAPYSKSYIGLVMQVEAPVKASTQAPDPNLIGKLALACMAGAVLSGTILGTWEIVQPFFGHSRYKVFAPPPQLWTFLGEAPNSSLDLSADSLSYPLSPRRHLSFAFCASQMILRDRRERVDFLRPPHAQPSFRAEQADFFFPLGSSEPVGLRREKSLFGHCGASSSRLRQEAPPSAGFSPRSPRGTSNPKPPPLSLISDRP